MYNSISLEGPNQNSVNNASVKRKQLSDEDQAVETLALTKISKQNHIQSIASLSSDLEFDSIPTKRAYRLPLDSNKVERWIHAKSWFFSHIQAFKQEIEKRAFSTSILEKLNTQLSRLTTLNRFEIIANAQNPLIAEIVFPASLEEWSTLILITKKEFEFLKEKKELTSIHLNIFHLLNSLSSLETCLAWLNGNCLENSNNYFIPQQNVYPHTGNEFFLQEFPVFQENPIEFNNNNMLPYAPDQFHSEWDTIPYASVVHTNAPYYESLTIANAEINLLEVLKSQKANQKNYHLGQFAREIFGSIDIEKVQDNQAQPCLFLGFKQPVASFQRRLEVVVAALKEMPLSRGGIKQAYEAYTFLLKKIQRAFKKQVEPFSVQAICGLNDRDFGTEIPSLNQKVPVIASSPTSRHFALKNKEELFLWDVIQTQLFILASDLNGAVLTSEVAEFVQQIARSIRLPQDEETLSLEIEDRLDSLIRNTNKQLDSILNQKKKKSPYIQMTKELLERLAMIKEKLTASNK